MKRFPVTGRTQVKRLAKRAAYDRDQVFQILDEGFVCHVGFLADGHPCVIPTAYARSGDLLYIHGSAASRMLNLMDQGVDVCVTVTLVDGLVLARSAFHHSINYRSVMIFGRACAVINPEEKLEALRVFSEHLIPGRWNDVRGPNDRELKGTLVLALPLNEVSAKIRSGPPLDDQEDYALGVWAGVLPLRMGAGDPVADERLLPGVPAPHYLATYRRSRT